MTQTAPTHDVCSADHAGWLSTPVRRLVTNPRRILHGLVQPGDHVADLGCGPGFFTLPLAEMVGGGSVAAVDLQPAMLDLVRAHAATRGLSGRIRLLECGTEALGLEQVAPLDFALAFWMIHEVPDAAALFAQVFDALRPGGHLLVAEPWGHVGGAAWVTTLDTAVGAGFTAVRRPRIAFSRSVLLERPH